MQKIIEILTALNSTQSLLIKNGVFGPGWVNDKKGPKITKDDFDELISKGYIQPLNRVQQGADGKWFAISQEGKNLINPPKKKEELPPPFKMDNRPAHYPKIPCPPKGWSAKNRPENVQIYDIFTLQDGTRIIVNEIRCIKKHAIHENIWEFIDRETGRVCHFNELEWIYDEEC